MDASPPVAVPPVLLSSLDDPSSIWSPLSRLMPPAQGPSITTVQHHQSGQVCTAQVRCGSRSRWANLSHMSSKMCACVYARLAICMHIACRHMHILHHADCLHNQPTPVCTSTTSMAVWSQMEPGCLGIFKTVLSISVGTQRLPKPP
jgi:hypothetical protein